MRRLKQILTDNLVENPIAMLYVDDIKEVLEKLRLGSRYNPITKVIYHCPEQEAKDVREGVSSIEITKRVILHILNSQESDIRFTAETMEDFGDRQIPTLNTTMWMEVVTNDGKPITRIRYQYFEKSMNIDTVLLRNTAMS